MKKIFALLAAFAALTSCSVKDLTGPESSAVSPILHASFEDGTDATKTYVNNSLHLFWTADDRLSVFLGTTYNQQYRFTGETGDNAGDFEEVPASGLHSGSDVNAIYAVYPYRTTTKLSYDGKSTVDLPAVQQYVPGSFGLGANTMVAVTAGKSDTFLSFKNLCGYLVVKLYGSGTVKSVTIEGNNGEKLAGKATVSASHNAAPSLALADDATTSITIDCGDGVELGSTSETATAFWFCIPPVTFSKGFTITAAGSAGSFSKSTSGSRTVERNVRVSMPALEFVPEGPAVPGMVDLGLPSGIKWASFNLGATAPEEYGGYYQWAGLKDVTGTSFYLDYSNCPFHTGSNSSSGWTKYVPSGKSSYWSGSGSPDNKTVLDPEDDVAHVKLGGKWRMPTKAEWDELINTSNCSWTWTTLNGKNGCKVQSKKTGFTDNWIFLPAAGFRDYDSVYYAGSDGDYWSSSLYTGRPLGAYSLGFYSGNVDTYDNYRYRSYGLSVRPVYDDGTGGQAVISVSPEEVEFGKVYLGESATGSFTISNTGTAAASVTITNPSDVVTSNVSGDITINAGASKTVTLTFTPKEKGSYGGRILVSCGGTDINVLYKGTCIEKGIDAPEAVDLGLPSGIKWASFNLGASKPEEYGGYYQWAGLKDVTGTSIYLDLSNCPFHTGSNSSSGWTKYVPSGKSSYWSGSGSPDNKTVLDPEDDVAHVKLGGKWRMPTKAEWDELLNNCTSEWTTLNGVNGRKFTSKKSGYTDKWIFLPAAGCRGYDLVYFAGSYGLYWSSSLYTDGPYDAFGMGFYSDYIYTLNDGRYVGRSVRPVSE